jgi:hypothetical protein
VSFSNKTINLSRYECARCSRTPKKAREIFQGCISDMDFLTIREREIGVYDINVEKMLVEKTKKGSTPIIAGNKGVFSIRLENLKN